MKLSIIVPIYNEAARLPDVLHYLFSSPCPVEREWILVDDGSFDGSGSILRSLQTKYGYRLISQTKNCGKGAAITRGIEKATGDFIAIQDADFEYDPADLGKLVLPLCNGGADVVYGSRFLATRPKEFSLHYAANRLLTWLSNTLSGIKLTDMETCYKVFRADLLKSMKLTSRRFGIEVELTALVAKTSARLIEVPIRYTPRGHHDGKKITWRDGIAALFHLVRFNLLTPRSSTFENLPLRYVPTPFLIAPTPIST